MSTRALDVTSARAAGRAAACVRLGTCAAICLGAGGCSLEGAPSYDLFGAHFPAWLLCAAMGIAAAFVFRGGLIATGLDDVMPLRLPTYAAFGTASALWLWLGLFGGR